MRRLQADFINPVFFRRLPAQGIVTQGRVLVGEVSQVNDDHTDNRFFEPIGRFPSIDEDEAPWRLLVSDYTQQLAC